MTMLQIGPVQFTVRGPGYDSLAHAARFEWPAQGRFGRRDALQFTGEGEESVQVQGTIYTDHMTGAGAIRQLKALARVPQMVVAGSGDVLGLWSIVDVTNVQTYAKADGTPRKIEFTVVLLRYGEDGGGLGVRVF